MTALILLSFLAAAVVAVPIAHALLVAAMAAGGGKQAAPFLGPYSASKFALEGLSEALRRELMIYGVDVIVISPVDSQGVRAAIAKAASRSFASIR